jgi:hypothetical protein
VLADRDSLTKTMQTELDTSRADGAADAYHRANGAAAVLAAVQPPLLVDDHQQLVEWGRSNKVLPAPVAPLTESCCILLEVKVGKWKILALIEMCGILRV